MRHPDAHIARSKLAVVLLCLAGALAGACAPSATDGRVERTSSKEADVPDVARVVCEGDGARVSTPKVAAQPDGVHYEIDNRLGGDYGYSVEFSGGGMGGNAPKGKSGHVGGFPPGEVRIGCYGSLRDAEPDLAGLEVVEGDSGYRSVELECSGGLAVSGGAQFAPGAKGIKGDLVEATRRRFSDEIRPGDTVELAGYPKLPDRRVVRMVREGRVVATVNFLGEPGDWLQDRYEACEEF